MHGLVSDKKKRITWNYGNVEGKWRTCRFQLWSVFWFEPFLLWQDSNICISLQYFSITQGSAGRLGCKRKRKSVANSSRKSLQETHFSETISCRNNGHGPRQCNKADGDNFKIFSDFTITCPFDTTIGCQSCIYDHFTRKWFYTAIWLKLHSTKKKCNIKNIATKC